MAAIGMRLALIASLISIRLGISVALIEIVVGVIAGNVPLGGNHYLLKMIEGTNFLATRPFNRCCATAHFLPYRGPDSGPLPLTGRGTLGNNSRVLDPS